MAPCPPTGMPAWPPMTIIRAGRQCCSSKRFNVDHPKALLERGKPRKQWQPYAQRLNCPFCASLRFDLSSKFLLHRLSLLLPSRNGTLILQLTVPDVNKWHHRRSTFRLFFFLDDRASCVATCFILYLLLMVGHAIVHPEAFYFPRK